LENVPEKIFTDSIIIADPEESIFEVQRIVIICRYIPICKIPPDTYIPLDRDISELRRKGYNERNLKVYCSKTEEMFSCIFNTFSFV
jgi:hypothetical protein